MKGIIVGNISNSYKIESSEKIYTATARGKFKNQDITPLLRQRALRTATL